jgi:2-dehydro-3-deoxyphosphogluconate aldolase / (4S)-4-hydroxy-2-oxoglutarate aldolase
MDKDAILRRLHEDWLVIILRGDTAQQTEASLDAIIEGSGTLLEVPFTTADACTVIANLRRRHGDRIVVSAGTVTQPEQARRAIDSGAQAIVSPSFYPAVVEVALEHGIIAAPGCFTPSEIAEALRCGADVIKLFPCYPVGPEYIGYIQGPLPGTRIMPAGAITLENMKAYYEAGAFAAVVGVTTEMQLLEAVRHSRYDEITACTRRWIQYVRGLQHERA